MAEFSGTESWLSLLGTINHDPSAISVAGNFNRRRLRGGACPCFREIYCRYKISVLSYVDPNTAFAKTNAVDIAGDRLELRTYHSTLYEGLVNLIQLSLY